MWADLWATLFPWLRAVLAYSVFLGVACILSANRNAISKRVIIGGMTLQIAAALLVGFFAPIRMMVEAVGAGLVTLIGFGREGTVFVFGWLALETKQPASFALTLLPLICLLSALAAGLHHLGVLGWIVRQGAKITTHVMGVSGPESLNAAANVFLGQTEAPLLIRPWLATLPMSGLLAVMIAGMGSIAIGVLTIYSLLLGGGDPQAQARFAVHLLTASVMSAPAGLMVAKILWPDTGAVDKQIAIAPAESTGLIDALCAGTSTGLKLAVNVGAMLIVFTALVALTNHLLARGPGEWLGINSVMPTLSGGIWPQLSLQSIFGWVFAPVAWLLGVDGPHLLPAAALLGEKLVLNEFFAYLSLTREGGVLMIADERTRVIMAYALCGFANLASIGIQVGGLGALVPERRKDFARLGWRALLGGTLVTCLNATVAGAVFCN